jgi:hypothetical protein
MKKNPVALGLTAFVFISWMAYLGVQVMKYRTPPVVVSRAQLLEAKYDVVADLQTGAGGKLGNTIVVETVRYHEDDNGPKVGQSISVENLSSCDGYVKPGKYILPLDGRLRVAGYPFDPGRFGPDPKPRIYPVTESVQKQFDELRK